MRLEDHYSSASLRGEKTRREKNGTKLKRIRK